MNTKRIEDVTWVKFSELLHFPDTTICVESGVDPEIVQESEEVIKIYSILS